MNGKKGRANLKKLRNSYKHISLDTNIFIYYFTVYPKLHSIAEDLFVHFAENKIKISASIITLTELLSLKTSDENIEKLENNFYQIPFLEVLDVNRDIASLSAKIRRRHNFLLPDSIHLASAIISGADIFITNDAKLKKFKGIEVALLKDFEN